MVKHRDPFSIRVAGGGIDDRELPGFSDRLYEGTGVPFEAMSSLRRAIHPLVTRMALLIVFVFGLILFSRLIWLQIASGNNYRNIAEGNRIRLEVLTARRGLILDRLGNPMAVNVPNMALVLIPADTPRDESERRKIFEAASQVVSFDIEALSTGVNWQSYVPMTLAEHLSHDATIELTALSSRLPGLSVKVLNERNYLLGDAVGHLLGYMGAIAPEDLNKPGFNYQYQDSKGVAGIESVYEKTLRGTAGRREVEVNNLGKPQQVFAIEEPIPGDNLTLTIDSELQKILVEAVKSSLRNNSKTRGAAVALDPSTGAILAMSSFPTFDPNLFSTGGNNEELAQILLSEDQPLFNRVYAGSYPIGSTIKPVVGVAALETGIVTPNTSVNSVGGVWAGNRWFADWKAGGHGITNIYKAIAESVNTYFYIIGGGTETKEGLGPDRLAEWLRMFGFGQVTGINLPSETEGLVPTPDWKLKNIGERWYLGDTYNLSIGQGNFLASPLQLAGAYSALVNGGIIWRPYFINVITDWAGNAKITEPEALKTLPISADNMSVIGRGMRETVLTGSARSLSIVPVATAGKTGTAQAPGGEPHAWFAGYIPYENPKMMLVVLVENGVEGSAAAVPVAREVFSWYAANRL